jgi:hypothetical protein
MNPPEDPLPGLLYQQQDLARLCAEQSLDWHEYAHMNEFHGNASILRRYAGLPENIPLPFALEHAIPYDLQEAYTYDLHSGLPLFLAVHEKSAALYRQKNMSAHPIGFSYLYALDLFQKIHPDSANLPARKGTLVFPDKSTLLMDTDFDREAFAQKLRSLPAEFQPVVVCIYWKDYVRGTHLPFVRAGLPLVTCGHLRDELFLLRLHDLCRRFRYSCANDLAGSFTLSVLSGCHFFHLPTGTLTQEKNGERKVHPQDPTLDKADKSTCLLASPFPPGDPTAQRALAEKLAGLSFKQNPNQIQNFYDQASQKLGARLSTQALKLPGSGTQPELLAFRPVGVDRDGWARSHSQFRIPAAIRATHLRFRAELPYKNISPAPVIEIFLNGKKIKTHRARKRRFTILLSLPPLDHSSEHLIECRCDTLLPLNNDNRTRAFQYILIQVGTSRFWPPFFLFK